MRLFNNKLDPRISEFDENGRIKRIKTPLKDNHLGHGHSVCNTCLKDMPNCWDTVCYSCGRTQCYDHSYVSDGHWFCSRHKHAC
jgi:hypothetical protein